ncbi:ABC transporter permease [Lactobacillus delbrueckii subsp. lactis]|jgi:oligopeptide transport system permease protein|uniref:oligopeptide ABC transporter permease n=1 Tax=Lactobacillus delbrueckii TaxID=1584 RepID=UPI0001EC2F68|nr:oligopeptide ABC transporter permease [Lactobacillus delbrueckii]ADQ60292.1 Oligopeptide ABC transporter, permease protein [Lactobacillus delbrueckii subsp. bulgaricus ND02]MBO3082819.1 ABC transporter permease [Lactobacillus delbrueckii subsp. bulgaricus]MCD5437967.1 ABC transporter permease [Lactobacillus delbrueckii subsp. lactis]MCD5468438.1 ABC transporter permease [Lactobacillus delbrueckii subsp. lactis]MCZ0796898.1 ABC transporter permease [Lactobacillus delbrueckii subsp. lactis]
MAKYLLKRIFYMILTLFLVATITFFLMKMMPGSPYANEAKMTATQKAIMNKQYGLDKPIIEQYITYLAGAAHGDFGISFQYSNQPVSSLIGARLGASAQLGLQALVVGIILGVIIGSIAAVNQGTWIDSTATIVSIIGKSVPNFVLAVLLQYYIGLKLGWFPIAGWGEAAQTIMPTIALSVGPLAETARFVRTEMVDTLSSDYVELGKAKGLSRIEVIRKHTLRNSMIPLVTLIGPYAVALMTGSMVIENIFNIPGIGEQFTKSILTNDYPTIMGVSMVYCFGLVVVLLLTDIVYSLIDPRIRLTD